MKFRCALPLFFLASAAMAEERSNVVEVEAGAISTRNMEIRGFEEGNATKDWSKTTLTGRVEDWLVSDHSWNFGVVFQPLSIRYKDAFRTDLNAKGQSFKAGDEGTLDYQFPTLRVSANKPLFESADGAYLRLGGSAVVRYARVGVSGSGQSFTDTNLIVIPLLNVEASRPLGAGYSLYTRSDFLPGISGSPLLDGLYDLYFGVRKHVGPSKDLDVGVRLFFGGYDPKKADDYANRIFYNALVVRYRF